MFLLESYLKSRKRKIADWEYAKEKYMNSGGSDDFRYEHIWVMNNPRPVKNFSDFGRYIGPVSIFIVALIFTTLICNSMIEDNKKVRNATTPGMNCRMFNKNDHIRIQGGDYLGMKGRVIGGCRNGEDYQIKLDQNQRKDIPGDGQDTIEVGGVIVAIGSYKDIIVIEDKEN